MIVQGGRIHARTMQNAPSCFPEKFVMEITGGIEHVINALLAIQSFTFKGRTKRVAKM
jgi:hypothetical protein